MRKQDIDSILLANWYFTKCKIESPASDKTELARKYLVTKVGKAITDMSVLNQSKSIKAFFILPLLTFFLF